MVTDAYKLELSPAIRNLILVAKIKLNIQYHCLLTCSRTTSFTLGAILIEQYTLPQILVQWWTHWTFNPKLTKKLLGHVRLQRYVLITYAPPLEAAVRTGSEYHQLATHQVPQVVTLHTVRKFQLKRAWTETPDQGETSDKAVHTQVPASILKAVAMMTNRIDKPEARFPTFHSSPLTRREDQRMLQSETICFLWWCRWIDIKLHGTLTT